MTHNPHQPCRVCMGVGWISAHNDTACILTARNTVKTPAPALQPGYHWQVQRSKCSIGRVHAVQLGRLASQSPSAVA